MKVQVEQYQANIMEPTYKNGTGFDQLKSANPCHKCEAPCCKMLLIPYPTPNTFMDLDYIKYMLGFPKINMILHKSGSWQVQVEQNCTHLNPENNLCELHNTPDKPKTCSFFNPYNCFYKHNFTGSHARSIIKINALAFEILINQIYFDEFGNIISIPSQDVIEGIAYESNRV